jgi:hypothetical protein
MQSMSAVDHIPFYIYLCTHWIHTGNQFQPRYAKEKTKERCTPLIYYTRLQIPLPIRPVGVP